MLCAMTVDVTVKTADPTAVVAATAEFPNIEVGVQVSGSFDPAGHVAASALPGGLVAAATHTGPIARLGHTHQAVRDWSTANGYRLAGPRWEVYGDPGSPAGDFAVEVPRALGAWFVGRKGRQLLVTALIECGERVTVH